MFKKGLLSLLLIFAMVFSIGCGSSQSAGKPAGGAEATEASSAEGGVFSGFGSDSASADKSTARTFEANEAEIDDAGQAVADEEAGNPVEGADVDRKIVYTSHVSIETKKFDDDLAKIKQLVSDNGGYFESTSVNGNKDQGNRFASLNARIPADKYDGFMNSVGEVGSLTSKDENVDDITSSYVDVQARLKSLNTKLERLQELEQAAENVTDLLEIEDRINSVQYEIENYTAQLKLYDKQVDYSTVSINVDEVATYTQIKKESAWRKFAEAFGGSFRGFVAFLQQLVIAIIYLLPYIIIVGIVLFIVIKVRKKKGKGPLFKRK